MMVRIYCEGKIEKTFFERLIQLRYPNRKTKIKFSILSGNTQIETYKQINNYISKQMKHIQNPATQVIVILDKDNFKDKIKKTTNYYFSNPCFEINLVNIFNIKSLSINKCANLKTALNKYFETKHNFLYEIENIPKIVNIYNSIAKKSKKQNTIEKIMELINNKEKT